MSKPKQPKLVDVPGSPEVCLLSNGRYSVMLTASGGGYSLRDGMDVTRWREDSTRDCWGQYCYVRDLDDGRAWSAGRQPLGRNADEYKADLRADRAIIRRRDGDVETCYEVAVVPDADAEVRRVTLTNRGDRPRTLEVTSYAEVALNPRRADQAHPAFAKLFLETEYLASSRALLCRRRPRAHDQQPVWALAGPGERMRRGRSSTRPTALASWGGGARRGTRRRWTAPLSGTVGPVLDPVFSLRQRIRVEPGASAVLAFTTAAPEDRGPGPGAGRPVRQPGDRGPHLRGDHRERGRAAGRAEAWQPDDAALFQRLAAPVLFASPSMRSRESVVRNRLGQPGLWPHAISGDLPIALVRIGADGNLEMAREVLRAHAYWRRCGLVADLVLLHDDGAGDELRRGWRTWCRTGPRQNWSTSRAACSSATHLACPRTTRHCSRRPPVLILRGGDGPLAAAAGPGARERCRHCPPPLRPRGRPKAAVAGGSPGGREALLFDNGLGGFTADGREYVITLRAGERPPAPWSQRARQSRLRLPGDRGRRRLHLGGQQPDESPHALEQRSGERSARRGRLPPRRRRPESSGRRRRRPCGGEATTVVRHGQGYSRFTRTSHGLEQDLLVLISPTEPVKLVRLARAEHGQTGRDACRRRSTPSGSSAASATTPPLQVVCSADAETARCSPPTPGRATSPGGSLSPPWPRSARLPRSFLHDRSRRVPGPRRALRQRRPPSGGRGSPAAPANWSTRAPH